MAVVKKIQKTKSIMSVSVIIPTFNRVDFLGRAMASVFAQSLLPDELLVVDDGSDDGTKSLVAGITQAAPLPVRYIYQNNRGASAARNLGVKEAGGDFLCFLDSDDRWDRKKIAIQKKTLQSEPEVLISHTGERWFRNGKQVNQKKKHAPGSGFIFSKCLKMCVVGMSTVMVRRELFDRYGSFNENLPCCEDYDLWLRVSIDQPFLLINKPLTIKEGGRDDQLSRIHRLGMDRFRIESICNLLKNKNNILSPWQRQGAVTELTGKCEIYGRGCIKHGRLEEGHFYLDIPSRFSGNDCTEVIEG